MNEHEKLIWVLTYAAAVLNRIPNPAKPATQAVIDLNVAEQRFNDDYYPAPPEDYPDEDFLF